MERDIDRMSEAVHVIARSGQHGPPNVIYCDLAEPTHSGAKAVSSSRDHPYVHVGNTRHYLHRQ